MRAQSTLRNRSPSSRPKPSERRSNRQRRLKLGKTFSGKDRTPTSTRDLVPRTPTGLSIVFDADGTLTIRVGGSITIIDTTDDPPLGIIGRKVSVRPHSIEL